LFDILADPTESRDVANQNPEVVSKLLSRLQQLNKGIFNPDRGTPELEACYDLQKIGYYQPFAHERQEQTSADQRETNHSLMSAENSLMSARRHRSVVTV